MFMNSFLFLMIQILFLIMTQIPPWMNETIKNKSLHKSNNFIEIQKLSTEISDMILKRKEKYHQHLSVKLNNPNTSSKTY